MVSIDTSDLTRLIKELEDVQENLNIPSIKEIYKSRIWGAVNRDASGRRVPSRSGLYISGDLKNTIDLFTHYILAMWYAEKVEHWYNQDIFSFDDEETEKLETNLWLVLNQ